jgi:hypothetical protein
MGNHWGSRKAFGRYANNAMRHRLAAAEDVSGDGGRSDGSIFVIHAADVGDVRDVGNVRHIADVSDVHEAKVVATIVIPGKKWLVGSKRKPGREFHRADSNSEREAGATDKCD